MRRQQQQVVQDPQPPFPSQRTLPLVVVVVGAGEQVPKDELRHIHLVLTVHYHGDALAIVPHADGVGLLGNGDSQPVHGRVPLLVVGSVHKDLVEDLEQPRHNGHVLAH